jgi:hypothetical protein
VLQETAIKRLVNEESNENASSIMIENSKEGSKELMPVNESRSGFRPYSIAEDDPTTALQN